MQDRGALEAATLGVTRSPHWHSVEQAVLAANPLCVGCHPMDQKEHVGLQVHHKYVSFHVAVLLGRPDLELDPRNLCVLGETEHDKPAPDHHLLFGHLKNFQRDCNPWIDEDIQRLQGRSTEEIEADETFKQHVANAPKVWGEWTLEEKQAKFDWLWQHLPPDPKIVAQYHLAIGTRPQ